MPKEVTDAKTFGNGRFVRNVYERVWGKAIVRCKQNPNDVVLTAADFDAAVQEINVNDSAEVRKISIGF